MSLTLRQMQVPIAVWLIASLAGTLAGPFGTFAALETPARAIYWTGIAGVAVLLDLAVRRLETALGRDGPAWEAGLSLLYALVMAAVVWGVNNALFSGWDGVGDYLYLVGIVLAIALILTALRWLLGAGQGTEAPDPARAAEARFLRNLPIEKRAPLIRIEAQDHYLEVVTTVGSELLLMRMRDAEAELDGARGLRVHRSHWVALSGVRGRRRADGRVFLKMADGAEVPVSRAHRPAAQAAGLC